MKSNPNLTSIYFLNRKTISVYFLDHDYSSYQTNYDQTYQDLAAYQGYDQSSLSSSPYVNEKQDDLDMDVSDLTKYILNQNLSRDYLSSLHVAPTRCQACHKWGD